MSVLLTFIPWLLYWVLLSVGNFYLAVWLAFISALVLNLNEWRQGNSKILTLGTTAFFLLMVLLVTLTRPSWAWREFSLMGSPALALIVFISIIVRKPFTLQYAMETTPKERWSSPSFIHANYIITWAWLVAFLFMSLPPAASLLGVEVPILFNWVFSICCFIGAQAFTNWYKKRTSPTVSS